MGYLARLNRHQSGQLPGGPPGAAPTLGLTGSAQQDIERIVHGESWWEKKGIFCTVPDEIMARTDLRTVDKFILGYVAGRTPKGEVCDSTMAQIATALGIRHRSTVMRSIRRLEAGGFLDIHVRPLPHPWRRGRFFYRLQDWTQHIFYRAWGSVSKEIKGFGAFVAKGCRLTPVLSFFRKGEDGVRGPAAATAVQLPLKLPELRPQVEDPEGFTRGLTFLPAGLRQQVLEPFGAWPR